jgi:hypothetical protein
MSDENKGENKGESERIAELEREVADLRERLEQQGAGQTAAQTQAQAQDQERAFFEGGEGAGAEDEAAPESEPPEPTGPADARDRSELEGHMPSRNRAIIIGVCVGAVALAAIVAIVLSLSQVITPLSKSAAGALEPFEEPAKKSAPAPRPEHPPVKAAPSPLRAPGL